MIHNIAERESGIPDAGAARSRGLPGRTRRIAPPVRSALDVEALSVTRPAQDSWASTLFRELGSQDWLIFGYFTLMFLAVLFGLGPRRGESLLLVGTELGILSLGLAVSRGGVLARGTFSGTLVYRLTVFGTVVSSYFLLRLILPAVSSRAVDGHLFAFDMSVLRVEPSLAWDKFVTPVTTEWFAFFYFGYFFVLAVHVLPFLLFVKRSDIAARFALGIFMVFCLGHLGYMVVPGFGPYRYLAIEFHHELTGGFFWGLVKETVEVGGAQKDIFPSLHTAVPTFFAFFSFRFHQSFRPFRYTWPLVGFVAVQIIFATMFLRWHYLVDIFAGLALAALSVWASDRVVTWETARRARLGLSPSWPGLNWPAHWSSFVSKR